MNSEKKWTPEPWETHPVAHGRDGKPHLFIRRRGDDVCRWLVNMIGRDGGSQSTDEANENAARIVACVNAMAGIPDPEAFMERANRIEKAAADVLAWFGDGSNNPIHPNDLRELRAALETKP